MKTNKQTKEKRHMLCKKRDCMWQPCYLEVVENEDGSISFIGDEWAESQCYAYPEQVKEIKKILLNDEESYKQGRKDAIDEMKELIKDFVICRKDGTLVVDTKMHNICKEIDKIAKEIKE